MSDPTDPADPTEPTAAPPPVDLSLRGAVLEIEKHAAAAGWDQPARLFALVSTAELLANDPSLAEVVGVDPEADLTGSLTPVEQDDLPADLPLEELLLQVMWPAEVTGTAVVVERLVLPPGAEDLPDDPAEAAEAAASHPDRQEVRMVAGATRAGSTFCALRLREHDEDFAVIEGPDLVPALLQLLQTTLVDSETTEL
jgi:hypothetical protein